MTVLFPAARQRVLALLLLHPDEQMHLRELARRSGTHAGNLLRELEKLAQAGLLQRLEQGNQVHYKANTGHALFPELASIFRKTHGATAILANALRPLGGQVSLTFVFGSMATGKQSVGSDVDLLVLGDVDFAGLAQVLYPLHQTLGREVNPVVYSAAEFAKRLKRQDAFAIELMAKPRLWVKGSEHDLAELAGQEDLAP